MSFVVIPILEYRYLEYQQTTLGGAPGASHLWPDGWMRHAGNFPDPFHLSAHWQLDVYFWSS